MYKGGAFYLFSVMARMSAFVLTEWVRTGSVAAMGSTAEPMISTVEEHVDAGRITPGKRVTRSALELAATWLEAYEGDVEDDGDNLTELATVAAFLRREAQKRKG